MCEERNSVSGQRYQDGRRTSSVLWLALKGTETTNLTAAADVEAVPVAAAMLELSSFIIGALFERFRLTGGSTSMADDKFAAISPQGLGQFQHNLIVL